MYYSGLHIYESSGRQYMKIHWLSFFVPSEYVAS